MTGSLLALVGATAAVLGPLVPAAWAVKCNTLGASCSWSSCNVDCGDPSVEGQLRGAVHLANACSTSAPQPRTVSFQNCSGAAPITLALTSTGGQAQCTLPQHFDDTAICITGNDITIDGTIDGGSERVNLVYGTPSECIPSGPGDEDGRALLVVTGSGNVITHFDLDYFPEGIHIVGGTGNRIDDVDSDHICDDVFSVDGGTGTLITGADLTGFTDGCPGGGGCTQNKCGRDKGISIGGNPSITTLDVEVRKNRFVNVGQPVNVNNPATNATLRFLCNDVQGSTTCDDVCQALNFDNGDAEVGFNKVDYCKFGVRVRRRARVHAHDNLIDHAWISAFDVICPKTGAVQNCLGTDLPKLKGERNKMRNYGLSTNGECQKAALRAVTEGPAPVAHVVDFGGGDCSGQAVVGGTVSSGGNFFCDGGKVAIWNKPASTCATDSSAVCEAARPVRARGNLNSFVGGATFVGKVDTGCFNPIASCPSFPDPLLDPACS